MASKIPDLFHLDPDKDELVITGEALFFWKTVYGIPPIYILENLKSKGYNITEEDIKLAERYY